MASTHCVREPFYTGHDPVRAITGTGTLTQLSWRGNEIMSWAFYKPSMN